MPFKKISTLKWAYLAKKVKDKWIMGIIIKEQDNRAGRGPVVMEQNLTQVSILHLLEVVLLVPKNEQFPIFWTRCSGGEGIMLDTKINMAISEN